MTLDEAVAYLRDHGYVGEVDHTWSELVDEYYDTHDWGDEPPLSLIDDACAAVFAQHRDELPTDFGGQEEWSHALFAAAAEDAWAAMMRGTSCMQ